MYKYSLKMGNFYKKILEIPVTIVFIVPEQNDVFHFYFNTLVRLSRGHGVRLFCVGTYCLIERVHLVGHQKPKKQNAPNVVAIIIVSRSIVCNLTKKP